MRNWLWIAAAVGATAPALFLRLGEVALPASLETILFGVAIIASAFLLTWAAEAAETEIAQALALAFIAIIAVLPEYAVDMYFAWTAATDPAFASYAAANMTGANRLMVGIGWPLVVLLAWFKGRKSSTRHVELGRGETSEVVFLALATIYAFTIPLKYAIFDGAGLSLWDTLVFIGLFALYMRSCSKCTRTEPELGGPAATITALPRKISWATIGSLFLFPAAVILASAQPFADGLLVAGREAGIDEFIMVQWVAPLASESPELLVAAIFVLKANSSAALRMLMSSKVNQWTLLVGMLPLVYSISLGSSGTLPLDGRQMEEILLTAAQSALALAFVIRLRLSAGSV
ncbi:MAG: sodium:calcium antiporter, partial [Dehalococcoidia bacterium]|nr:sodium:calcium antiporter [Dehalococcoidia bacterium]